MKSKQDKIIYKYIFVVSDIMLSRTIEIKYKLYVSNK